MSRTRPDPWLTSPDVRRSRPDPCHKAPDPWADFDRFAQENEGERERERERKRRREEARLEASEDSHEGKMKD